MDIEGLSESRLEKFIGCGFLHSYMDIYRLDRHQGPNPTYGGIW